jgi:hypothetical protein
MLTRTVNLNSEDYAIKLLGALRCIFMPVEIMVQIMPPYVLGDGHCIRAYVEGSCTLMNEILLHSFNNKPVRKEIIFFWLIEVFFTSRLTSYSYLWTVGSFIVQILQNCKF